MSKKILFIESNTTGTGMLALKKAKELGFIPVMITNYPQRYHGVEDTCCEVLICNTNSVEELKKSIEPNFIREEIAGITTTSDFYLEAAAELSTHYGLPGNSPEAVRLCRNKSKTRTRFAEAGIGQPKFAIVHSEKDIEDALKIVGLPCVVKPADDSGSNNVLYCETEEAVKKQTSHILKQLTNIRGQQTVQTVLFEEYLKDPEYSVETFTWQNKTVFLGITEKKLIGFPYFVECGHNFRASLTAEQQAEIQKTVYNALQAVGITYGPIHTEVKLTEKGCAIVEINARLAGGMIPELIRYVTGIDMLENQIKAAASMVPDLDIRSMGYAGIRFLVSEKEGVFKGVSGIEKAQDIEGIKQVSVTYPLGKSVCPPQNAYDRLGFVIAACETYEQLEQSLQTAVESLSIYIEPESTNKAGGIQK